MTKLGPDCEVITFDCYGTLVDWHEVLLREIGTILERRHSNDVSALAILHGFSEESRRLTAEPPHRPYREILCIGFAAAFADHGISVTGEEIERVASSPMRMGPHLDVPNALNRLRDRYRLALFTNSDDDLIAPTVTRIGVPFDYVITAEQARAYKPSRRFFEYAHQKMGMAPDETAHVAMGMYTDMKACGELGLRAIWVNRRAESGNPEWQPYPEVNDLDGAAALLLPP